MPALQQQIEQLLAARHRRVWRRCARRQPSRELAETHACACRGSRTHALHAGRVDRVRAPAMRPAPRPRALRPCTRAARASSTSRDVGRATVDAHRSPETVPTRSEPRARPPSARRAARSRNISDTTPKIASPVHSAGLPRTRARSRSRPRRTSRLGVRPARVARWLQPRRGCAAQSRPSRAFVVSAQPSRRPVGQPLVVTVHAGERRVHRTPRDSSDRRRRRARRSRCQASSVERPHVGERKRDPAPLAERQLDGVDQLLHVRAVVEVAFVLRAIAQNLRDERADQVRVEQRSPRLALACRPADRTLRALRSRETRPDRPSRP